jgi:hypothetical protein
VGAEIEAQGLTVERIPSPPPDSLEAAVRQALAAGARVAVVAYAGKGRTEVWSASPSDRVGLKQALEVDAGADPEAALPVLALRTVELLRADFGLGPATPPPAPPVRSPAAVMVTGGAGILASTGRLGPLPIAGLALAARLAPWFGAELWGCAPLATDTLRATAGSAEAAVWLAGAGLLFGPPTQGRLVIDFGTGPMLAVVRATGTANPPAAGTTDQQLGVALYARASAHLRAGTSWTFGLQLFGGGAIRRPVVTFVDQDVTRWGAAFAALLANARYTF